MKIIFDNIVFSIQRSGGISVYWYELLRRFLSDQQVSQFDSKVYQSQQAKLNLFANKLHQEVSFPFEQESGLPVRLLRYLDFRKNLQKDTIFHSSYYRYANGATNIITIYDFTYAYYRSGLAKAVFLWQQANAIKKAAGIICISEHTKKDLLEFYPEIDVPVEVIYMGKSEQFCVLEKQHQYSEKLKLLLDRKFCLFVGDRKNYKNFNYMLEQLPANQFLVIVGGGELDSQEKNALQQHLGNNYYHFKRPDINELNELYNLAFCLIYPSDYEGFGIPVIEAMAAGCPVVCQSVSSLTEVAGDAGLYFEKNRSQGKYGSISDVLEKLQDKNFYQQIVIKGIQNAEQFSWDKCYQQTIAFYKSFSQSG